MEGLEANARRRKEERFDRDGEKFILPDVAEPGASKPAKVAKVAAEVANVAKEATQPDKLDLSTRSIDILRRVIRLSFFCPRLCLFSPVITLDSIAEVNYFFPTF